MANYVKNTNFAVKDGLPSGDPQKVVKGTEIDTEFNNISTAINSKSDASNPTFLGTPFAPTAPLGTNTNQIATTAFVIQTLYPVGSVYINATNATNPSTLFGFGTWVAFGAGRVPVGFNAADPLFDSAEETGGSKDAIVVAHTHTGTTSSAGTHKHNLRLRVEGTAGGGRTPDYDGTNLAGTTDRPIEEAGAHTHDITLNSTGSSGTNANLQPYITVFMWKRTA